MLAEGVLQDVEDILLDWEGPGELTNCHQQGNRKLRFRDGYKGSLDKQKVSRALYTTLYKLN